jgi:hypothetical protein
MIIIRNFNDPSNFDLVQDIELIPQDIGFLRKNGLKVDILESNSVVSLCRVSRDTIREEKTDEVKSISL